MRIILLDRDEKNIINLPNIVINSDNKVIVYIFIYDLILGKYVKVIDSNTYQLVDTEEPIDMIEDARTNASYNKVYVSYYGLKFLKEHFSDFLITYTDKETYCNGVIISTKNRIPYLFNQISVISTVNLSLEENIPIY